MKKSKKINKMSICMYIASAILLLATISPVSTISYDVISRMNKGKGYTFQQMYTSFTLRDYVQLDKQVQCNIAAGREITYKDRDFYSFAACYESAVNYHMYIENKDMENANKELAVFNENYNAVSRRFVKDALDAVKTTYGIV